MAHQENILPAFFNLLDYGQELLRGSLINSFVEAQFGADVGGRPSPTPVVCRALTAEELKTRSRFTFSFFKRTLDRFRCLAAASVQGALNIGQGFILPARFGMAQQV